MTNQTKKKKTQDQKTPDSLKPNPIPENFSQTSNYHPQEKSDPIPSPPQENEHQQPNQADQTFVDDTAGSHKLTLRQKKLVAAVAAGKGITEASKLAGYGKKQSGWNALQKPRVQAELTAVFEEAGLTREQIAKNIRKLTKAKEHVYFKEFKVGERPDNRVRLAANELALKARGELATGSPPGSRDSNQPPGQHLHLHLVEKMGLPTETVDRLLQAFQSVGQEASPGPPGEAVPATSTSPEITGEIIDVHPYEEAQTSDKETPATDHVDLDSTDPDGNSDKG